jgi:thymidylate synthase ThyX
MLHHIVRKLSGGGEVIVLDTGSQIGPESEAMLQALHSRSTGGLMRHLKILEEKGSEGFMKTFYVGYGHKSIADCGSASVFIEGVSMLAAKAVQDWRLYSGQEASTRYIDFSAQPFINPIASSKSAAEILEKWRALYLEVQDPVDRFLRERFPRQDGEDENVYGKAIAARRFDITRSILPAGASTNLSWHSNLRQFSDGLAFLRHHPLVEVQEIAQAIENALQEAFPGSFDMTKRYPETEAYYREWMQSRHLYAIDRTIHADGEDFRLVKDSVDRDLMRTYGDTLRMRPERTELPGVLAECGTLQYEFLLDFGSFRDVQRHRAAVQRMPLLTTRHGFHEWYVRELPESLRVRVESILTEQQDATRRLGLSAEEEQYFIPMGYRVPCRVTGDMKALLYLAELRSTRFVHPTLRAIALRILDDMEERFRDFGLVVHRDADPHRFDIRRGLQDIVAQS